MKWGSFTIIFCVLLVALSWFAPVVSAATIRGDFNGDGVVNLADAQALIPNLHTINQLFALTGADNFIDLFDYNELLTTMGTTGTNTPTQLKVMTFNVLRNEFAFCGSAEAEQRLAQTIGYLVSNQYDVLYLQESGCIDVVAAAWQNKLRQTNPNARMYYSRLKYAGVYNVDMAILSRYPLTNAVVRAADVANTAIPLEVTPEVFTYQQGLRKILHVIANVNGTQFRLMNTHPEFPGCNQIQDQIRGYISQFNDKPIIFGGDLNCNTDDFYSSSSDWIDKFFNLTCFSPNYKNDQNCGPSSKALGELVPWKPSDGPIDHIGISKTIAASQNISGPIDGRVLRVPELQHSDHWPVTATFTIGTTSPASTAVPTPTPTITPVPTISLTPTPTTPASALKVMTFNVSTSGADQRAKMKRLAQYLDANRIDIVGFQEMVLYGDFVKYLKEALQEINSPLVYVADGHSGNNIFRVATFSRYPITRVSEKGIFGARTILDAEIETPLGKYIVINTHISNRGACGSIKDDLIPNLNQRRSANPNLIAMGDMNAVLYADCLPNSLQTNFLLSCVDITGKRSCSEDSWTSPAGGSLIDYILLNRTANATISSPTIDLSLGYDFSDHRPVTVLVTAK